MHYCIEPAAPRGEHDRGKWRGGEEVGKGDTTETRAADLLGRLTAMERRIADLVVEGLTNPQIGERCFISARTVQAHLANAYKKLNINSRAQLAALVVRGQEQKGREGTNQPSDLRK